MVQAISLSISAPTPTDVFNVPENSLAPFTPPSLKVICSMSSKHITACRPKWERTNDLWHHRPAKAPENGSGKERRRGKKGEWGDVEGEIMSLSPCIPPPAHNAHFPPFSQQIRFSSGGQPPLQLEQMREKWESEGKGEGGREPGVPLGGEWAEFAQWPFSDPISLMNPNEGFNKITLYNLSLHQSVESHSYQTNCVHKPDEINIRFKPVCVSVGGRRGGFQVGTGLRNWPDWTGNAWAICSRCGLKSHLITFI